MALRSKEIKKEGIVIGRVETGEGDLMVRLLSKEGPLSFYARGVKKLTSKNRPALLLLSEGEYSLREGPQGGLSLQEGLLKKAHDSSDNLEKAVVLSFLAELSNKVLAYEGEEERSFETAYLVLRKLLGLLDEGYDPLSAAALYFAFVLKEEGLGLTVNECVRTKEKRDIAGLSWRDGGFLSRKALLSSAEKRTPYELKMVRYLFLIPPEKMGDVAFERKATLRFLREARASLEESLNVELKSLDALKVL